MKKLICAMLAILSVFMLCACNAGPTNSAGVVMATEAPNEEERELIVDYYYIVTELEDGTPTASRQAELYQQLKALSAYDKYIGTEYASTSYLKRSSGKLYTSSYGYDISTWDRHEVLRRFTVIDNKLISVTRTEEDRMGNKDSYENFIQWNYNPDGQLLSIDDENRVNPINLSTHNESFLEYSDGQREYDENGRLLKITHMDYDQISMIRTFTYDANGNLSQQVAKNNDKERVYTYTCDQAGKITAISWTDFNGNSYEIAYTYDGNGNLLSEVKSLYNQKQVLEAQWSMTHSYDSKGQRVESAYLWQDHEDTHWSLDPDFVSDRFVMYSESSQYTYEYADGKISRVTQIPGSRFGYKNDGTVSYETAPDEAFIYFDLNYGTYCFYNAPVIEY